MLLGDGLQNILVQPCDHIGPSLHPGCILLIMHPPLHLLEVSNSHISLYILSL